MFALVAFALLGSASARVAAGRPPFHTMGQFQAPMMRSDDGSDGFDGFPSDGNGLPTVFDPNFQDGQFPDQFPDQTLPSFDETQQTTQFDLPPFPIGNGLSFGLQHSIEIGVNPMNVPDALQLASDANILQVDPSQGTAVNTYQMQYNNQQLCMYKFLIGSNPQMLSCMVTDCSNSASQVSPLDCNQYDDIRDDSSSLVPNWVPQDEFGSQ